MDNTVAKSVSNWLIKTFMWVWILAGVCFWEWPYSGIGNFDTGFFEVIFGTLVALFMHFWLIPTVLGFGSVALFLLSVGSGIATFFLSLNFLKKGGSADMFEILAPIATGIFAYFAVVPSYNFAAEIYLQAFGLLPEFISWISDRIPLLAILYLLPNGLNLIRSFRQRSDNHEN